MSFTRLFLFSLVLGVALGVLSLEVMAQNYSALFQHSVRVGYDSRTCAAGLEGAIRFNSGTGAMQVCRLTPGAAWADWSGL